MLQTNSRFICFVWLLPAFIISGCNAAFHDLGTPPSFSEVGTGVPIEDILVGPQPEVIRAAERIEMADNGIWNQKDGIYFRDTRAYEVGDILTVRVSMNESARFNNKSEKDSSFNGTLGGASTMSIPGITVPDASIDGSLALDLARQRGGSVNRTEKLQLRIAAAVVEASSNGNLKIVGTQEIRVNSELRIMTVQGIVRSKDILPDNSIPYEKIAEARISYGGHNTRQIARKGIFKKLLPGQLAQLGDSNHGRR